MLEFVVELRIAIWRFNGWPSVPTKPRFVVKFITRIVIITSVNKFRGILSDGADKKNSF